MHLRLFAIGLCLFLGTAGASFATADGPKWPQFRGPGGQGIAEFAHGVPVRWSETENVAWKTPLPGGGWSSPVIDGDEIWMTTAITTPASEAEKKRRTAGSTNSQPLTVLERLGMRAICVHRSSGQLIADVDLMTESKPDPIHALNSYASPTPVIEDGRLYCHFGTYGTACLETKTRKVLWTNRDLRIKHENGPGSSPIVWRDLLIFHCDGSDEQYIVALKKQTGKIAWKTPRSGKMNSNPQLKKAYGTPLVVSIDGAAQLISPAADWLYAYDPDSGKELWKLNYGTLGFSIVPRPVAGNGMIYMCTSFMQSELLAVRYNTEKKQPEIAWRHRRQAPQMPSPLLVGKQLYIVSDSGVATCLDAKTGRELWQKRLGGSFAASPVLVGGRIYFFNRDGETTVILPAATYEEIAKNKLDGSHMASAAIAGAAMFLRTDKALYRIESPPDGP